MLDLIHFIKSKTMEMKRIYVLNVKLHIDAQIKHNQLTKHRPNKYKTNFQ